MKIPVVRISIGQFDADRAAEAEARLEADCARLEAATKDRQIFPEARIAV